MSKTTRAEIIIANNQKERNIANENGIRNETPVGRGQLEMLS